MKRATSYAERLRLSIAVIHGEEPVETEEDDGRHSPPLHEHETDERRAEWGIEIMPCEYIDDCVCAKTDKF